eukprot:2657636-Rhodomonas_salina.1
MELLYCTRKRSHHSQSKTPSSSLQLRTRYAMRGADIGYTATRCATVLLYAATVCCYQMCYGPTVCYYCMLLPDVLCCSCMLLLYAAAVW